MQAAKIDPTPMVTKPAAIPNWATNAPPSAAPIGIEPLPIMLTTELTRPRKASGTLT